MNDSKLNLQETDEINFKEIIVSLLESKLMILSIVSTFAIGSVLFSLYLPNKFISSSTLALVNSGAGGQSSSSLDMLRSIPGINLGSSDNTQQQLIITTIKSRDFLRHLLTFDNIKPTLAAFKSYDQINKKILYKEDIYDSITESFTKDPLKLPTFQHIYDEYRSILNLGVQRANGLPSSFIDISINHESPEFAYSFLSLIITEINTLSRKKDLVESEDSLQYLYNELAETQQVEIKNSINQLIISELRRQMLAEVNLDYLVNPLDKPNMPEIKSSPNRSRICILGTILGFFIAILISFIRYFGFRENT